MPKLLVCLLSCLIFVVGCAQTGPGQYHVGVDTIIKGISQGKMVVDSTEVVEANIWMSEYYGVSRTSHRPSFEWGEARIKDGYILCDFTNITKEADILGIDNFWGRPRPESLPSGVSYSPKDNLVAYSETNMGEIAPGQTVTVKIKIPEGLGKVDYEGQLWGFGKDAYDR